MPGLEEDLVELPAGGGAAGAEELDAGVDVEGHHSSSKEEERRRQISTAQRPLPTPVQFGYRGGV